LGGYQGFFHAEYILDDGFKDHTPDELKGAKADEQIDSEMPSETESESESEELTIPDKTTPRPNPEQPRFYRFLCCICQPRHPKNNYASENSREYGSNNYDAVNPLYQDSWRKNQEVANNEGVSDVTQKKDEGSTVVEG